MIDRGTRIRFEKYLIHVIENKAVWESSDTWHTMDGFPRFKLIMYTDNKDVKYAYAVFDCTIRLLSKGKGNCIWIYGNYGIYETMFDNYSSDQIKKLNDRQSSNLN